MASTLPAALRPASQILTTPLKPLLRRNTLVRKRDELGDETEHNADPPSPGKRAKVSFNAEVQVRVMENWEKTPGLIREEVRRALQKHSVGENAGYEQIKEVYLAKPQSQDAPSATTTRNHTAALLNNIALIDKSCADLIHAILDSQWLGRDQEYVNTYLRLMANLVVTQAGVLPRLLRILAENLTSSTTAYLIRDKQMLMMNPAPLSSGRLPGQSTVTRSQIYARVHQSLRYLLQLVPSASGTLFSVLISSFPHPSDSRRAHVVYVQNLLKLFDYAPELRAEVLALITEHLVKIDVQVQDDLGDLTEDVGEGLVQGIPRLLTTMTEDADESDDSGDESETSDETMDADSRRTKDILDNVEKMDIIMDMLFAYYTQTSTATADRESTLAMLLTQFTTIILPALRSRHVQFLLFHFAQKSPELIDIFVGTCVQIAFAKGRPAIIRQAAVAYLASFVARGVHVPANIVRDVFDYISSQLTRLRTEAEPTCRGPDLGRYSSYYSLVQALLYIFCFRWQDLKSSPDTDSEDVEDSDFPPAYVEEHTWRYGIKEALSANVFSKLNPLKVCSPSIVSEFARIGNHLGVIYVFHLIETNKRIRLSKFVHNDRETALNARKDDGDQHLDAYFPFDPYHLPKSKRWIEGDYREWIDVQGGKDTESEDEDEEDDSDIGEGTETEDSEDD